MAPDGAEDEDYFTHFGDLELTEEDLARIDRICETDAPVPEPVLPLPKFEGEPQLAIEVEKEPILEVVSSTLTSRSPMSESPYDAFRSGKSLSVSDLTGPLWYVDWQGNRVNLAHPLTNAS